jgi:hypothetical protein
MARTCQPPRPLRIGLILVAALLVGCGDGDGADFPETAMKAPDLCGGRCSEIELCTPDQDGEHACAQICANQLRCWSGCCLPVADTKLSVCRSADACFAD